MAERSFRCRPWDATLTEEQQRLIKFMIDDRNVEVHESGSSRRVGIENRELGLGIHKLASGTGELFGPPGVPPAIIQTPAYYFTIDGTERKATEACGEYLALLEQMVAAFKADKPTEIESEIDAVVEVVAPVLKGEGMWRFLFGSVSLTAKLSDDEFLQRVESGEESFHNGDLLKVRLKTVQEKHFIVKVVDRA